jgi:hypothetical protein
MDSNRKLHEYRIVRKMQKNWNLERVYERQITQKKSIQKNSCHVIKDIQENYPMSDFQKKR